jgi:purine-binding chemotaxis protein CheW
MSMSEEWNTNQYLTFTLSRELFALNIASVKEVLEHTKITKVPRTPGFMKGVINLRGHAVPIVDMRLKFGMSQGEITVNTCIIIVEVKSDQAEIVQIGALVDSVREVIEMNDGQVEPPPKMGLSVNTDFIRGMAKQGDDFVLILDVQKIFSAEELAAASSVSADDAEDGAQTAALQQPTKADSESMAAL